MKITEYLEYAELFARYWTLNASLKTESILRILEARGIEIEDEVTDNIPETGLIHMVSGADLELRTYGEHAQKLMSAFQELLKFSQFTEPAQEYLWGYRQFMWALGLPASQTLPLEELGIDLESGLAVPYDITQFVRMGEVEGRLLLRFDKAIPAMEDPEVRKMEESNSRHWHETYKSAYHPMDFPQNH